MHEDLKAWLDKVWTDKEKIIAKSPTGHSGRGIHLGNKNLAIWEVYDIYKSSDDSSSEMPSFQRATVCTFIENLDEVEKNCHPQTEIQFGDDFVNLNRGELIGIISKPLETKTQRREKITLNLELISGEEGDCFVHFRKRKAAATDRIYLNVRSACLGEAFQHIYSLIHNEPSLTNAKVASPGLVRADSIVIYLGNRKGIEPVIAKIRTYYMENQTHFGAATPKLTSPVKGMPGVALGMEPPSITVLRSGGQYYAAPVAQSFGFYRASLIFMALDRTRFNVSGQQDKDRAAAFKRRAAKYFLAAGIDPDRPSEQGTPKNLKPLDELGRWIEGDLDDDGYYKAGTKVHAKK